MAKHLFLYRGSLEKGIDRLLCVAGIGQDIDKIDKGLFCNLLPGNQRGIRKIEVRIQPFFRILVFSFTKKLYPKLFCLCNSTLESVAR